MNKQKQAAVSEKDSMKEACCKTDSKSDACCAEKEESSAQEEIDYTCLAKGKPYEKEREECLIKIREEILEKSELKRGYSFSFHNRDSTYNLLSKFIEYERNCCSFLDLSLHIKGGSDRILLLIEGENGVKDFINNELDMY